jgi:hypothetical protein
MDGSWPLEHRRPRGKESAQTQPRLMRAKHGNPVVVRRAMRAGKPIVRGAELLDGTGCPRSECRWPKGDRKARGVADSSVGGLV